MSLKLFNTATKQKTEFTPQDPYNVTMYVCGPTVYNHPHIGNARAAVAFDMLYRILQHNFPKVTYVRNITDVDDKINKAAVEQNVPINVITDKFIEIYHNDIDALNCLRPTIEPRATDHIAEMIDYIGRLMDGGFAYEAEGHVLFEVAKYDGYGELSRRELDEMQAGARVEVAPYKKDPMDFVLWKPSDDSTPGWESPWGVGRPGWHIECSAMIEKHLGNTIDIHGGGLDLTFPHHENERAQATCAHDGETYARFWVHNGFVNVNNEKMSKSLGNVMLPVDMLKEYDGEVIRFALLSTHYRSPLDWDHETLPRAKATLDKWYKALEKITENKEHCMSEKFVSHLNDDMNIPGAIALIHTAAKNKESSELKAMGNLLGILQKDPEEWFASKEPIKLEIDVEALIAERNQARANKNWGRSDEIRDELKEAGIIIKDGPEGTTWELA